MYTQLPEGNTHSMLSYTVCVYRHVWLHTVILHMSERLHTQKLLHRDAFTHRSFYTPHSKLLHTKSFTLSKLLQKKVFTQRSFLVHNHNRNCSSKTGWISTPKRKKDDFEALFKMIFKRINYSRQNWENLLTNQYRSLDAATPIRFTMSSCKRQ